MKLDVSRCLLLIIVALGLVGCMPAVSSEASFLLGQDYLRMTNAELITYEQELNDELGRTSSSDHSDVNVGIGIGSWGGDVGYGVSADRWLGGGGKNDTALELKNRRDEVRDEMRRKNLLLQ